MQQQMFDQFHQTMMMMFEGFAALHREQSGTLREEFEQVRKLSQEIEALRAETARLRRGGRRRAAARPGRPRGQRPPARPPARAAGQRRPPPSRPERADAPPARPRGRHPRPALPPARDDPGRAAEPLAEDPRDDVEPVLTGRPPGHAIEDAGRPGDCPQAAAAWPFTTEPSRARPRPGSPVVSRSCRPFLIGPR